ncbi:hypothetical protein [Silvanigrella aquatica]|uniref:Uncharacterized protein n=1 Tax=Silvanigrella aquatica TaxID=1915309 RepID=A0A1L4D0T8_9BACT|nr:hypothetical protein [Silvanigrella aquatica]APJ03832.1 hypothetical protein AXG55_07900 [Silvanigrella aquatica]
MLPRYLQEYLSNISVYFILEIFTLNTIVFLFIFFYSLRNEKLNIKIINIILNLSIITSYLVQTKEKLNIFSDLFFIVFIIFTSHIITKLIIILNICFITSKNFFISTKKRYSNLNDKNQKNNSQAKTITVNSPKRTSPYGTPQIMTSFGLKVRSKSEVFIAEKLYEKKINFKYEQPLSAGEKTYYPDFTIYLGNKEFYWEHFGMLSDENYALKTEIKIKWYKKHFPDRLIWTQEDSNLVPQIHEIAECMAKSKRLPRHFPHLPKFRESEGHAFQNRRT